MALTLWRQYLITLTHEILAAKTAAEALQQLEYAVKIFSHIAKAEEKKGAKS